MRRDNIEQRDAGDGSALTVAVVYSQYYEEITGSMYKGALEALAEWGVKEGNIISVPVSGSYEVPYGCLKVLKDRKPDAVVSIGCIIKGETSHDHHIATAIMNGIMDLTIKYETPIGLGIINANNLDQAIARSSGENNKGKEAAVAALEMATLNV